MGIITTPALVIRRSDYSDYDRMVSLFTPDLGRLDVMARGCRRPKSPLFNCAEPFTVGEYQLLMRGDRLNIMQFRTIEAHMELRTDYERLVHGAYWLKILETGIMHDAPARDIYAMTLKALAYLNYSELPPVMLTLAFESYFMYLSGMGPRMDNCIVCGCPIDGDARFDIKEGGAVCHKCRSAAIRVSNGARRIIMKLPRARIETLPLLELRPEWPEAAALMRRYVEYRMGVPKKFIPPL